MIGILIFFIILILILLLFAVYCLISYNNAREFQITLNNIDYSKYGGKKILGNIPIYYINLDHSTSRNRNMVNQLKDLKLHAKRIRAVGKKDLDDNKATINTDFGPLFIESKDAVVSKNEHLATTMSHLKTIYTAFKNNDDVCLILEDDVNLQLVPFWTKSLPDIIKEAPPDWNVIKLIDSPLLFFRNFNCKTKSVANYKNYKKITGKCWNAGAYLINRNGMKNILAGMKHNHVLITSKPNHDKVLNYRKRKEIADEYIYSRGGNSYQYISQYPLVFSGEFLTTIRNTKTPGLLELIGNNSIISKANKQLKHIIT